MHLHKLCLTKTRRPTHRRITTSSLMAGRPEWQTKMSSSQLSKLFISLAKTLLAPAYLRDLPPDQEVDSPVEAPLFKCQSRKYHLSTSSNKSDLSTLIKCLQGTRCVNCRDSWCNEFGKACKNWSRFATMRCLEAWDWHSTKLWKKWQVLSRRWWWQILMCSEKLEYK